MRRNFVAFVASLAIAACGGGEEGHTSSNTSGSTAQHTASQSPAGLDKAIVWRTIGQNHRNLYLVNEDGTGVVTLADANGVHVYKGTAPGGRIVFETYFPAEGQSDLFSVNPDGTGLIDLTASQDVETYNGVTRSNYVVYTHQMVSGGSRDIRRVSLDGIDRCSVAETPDNEIFLGLANDDRVIFNRCSAPDACALYIGDCAGATRLTEQTADLVGTTRSGQIVYTVQDAASLQRFVFSVNTDGSTIQSLGAVDDNEWSVPRIEGDSIVWVENGNIVLSTNGGTSVVLADESTAAYPRAFTPDGRLIYQVGGANRPTETNDVYSVRLDGTDRQLLAGTSAIEYFHGMTQTGRALYQRYAPPGPNPGAHELRSVKADGTGDVLLSGDDQWNAAEGVTPGNRVVYLNSSNDGTAQHRDYYATNDDGSDNRFLMSGNKYLTATRNDSLIFGSPCLNPRPSAPPVNSVCPNVYGDVVAIKSDGTGLVSLASGSEDEGLEGLYAP